jgi:hypothetical protein
MKLFLSPSRYYHKVDSCEGLNNITLKMMNDSTYLYLNKVEIPDNLKMMFNQLVECKKIRLGHFIFIYKKRFTLLHL